MYQRILTLLLIFIISSCSPFGAEDNNGNIKFSPPNNQPIPTYPNSSVLTFGVYDYDVTNSVSVVIHAPLYAEDIVNCSIHPSLPVNLTLSSDCSITGTLSHPFAIVQYSINATTVNGNYYTGSISIGGHVDACSSNSLTSTSSLYGMGTSSNPYIICNNSQFENLISMGAMGYISLQADIVLSSSYVSSNLNNTQLNGYGHKISYDINSAGMISSSYEKIGLFFNINNSTIERTSFYGKIRGQYSVSLIGWKLNNAILKNINIESGSEVYSSSGLGEATGIASIASTGSINILDNIIVASNYFASAYYNPFIVAIDANDLNPVNINSFTNIKVYLSGASTGGVSTSNQSFYSTLTSSIYNDSGSNLSNYSSFNNNYWQFDISQSPKLKKEKIHVYE